MPTAGITIEREFLQTEPRWSLLVVYHIDGERRVSHYKLTYLTWESTSDEEYHRQLG